MPSADVLIIGSGIAALRVAKRDLPRKECDYYHKGNES